MKKILIVGDDYVGSEPILQAFARFRDAGYELVAYDWLHGGMEVLSEINRRVELEGPESPAAPVPEEVFRLIQDANILIVEFLCVPKALIDAAPHLEAVGTLRTGLENIDVDYVLSKGIRLFHTPGRLAEAVSDYTIGFMLCEARNIARGYHAIKTGHWRKDYANSAYTPELKGRVVGLIGFGEIGRLVAKKLRGFDVEIIAYDPYVDPAVAEALGVRMVDLDTLLKESDFVSIHARATAENEHLIGARELSLMKPTAFLINTARSSLVDEEALYEALRSRQIGGAALDVFDQEPIGPDHPLATLDNCTVTPHLAGTSVDAMLNCPKLLAREMWRNLIEGEETRFLVRRKS